MERVGVNVSASFSKSVHGEIIVGKVLRDSACKSKSFGKFFSYAMLTLRLLMSYIYIYIYMEHLFLMFLDHTQRRSTVGRTPLDE